MRILISLSFFIFFLSLLFFSLISFNLRSQYLVLRIVFFFIWILCFSFFFNIFSSCSSTNIFFFESLLLFYEFFIHFLWFHLLLLWYVLLLFFLFCWSFFAIEDFSMISSSSYLIFSLRSGMWHDIWKL